MNIRDKKFDIINRINQTSDEDLIDKVYQILHFESEEEQFRLEEMPVELQQKLRKALSDYDSGNYITHEQLKQKIDSWRMK